MHVHNMYIMHIKKIEICNYLIYFKKALKKTYLLNFKFQQCLYFYFFYFIKKKKCIHNTLKFSN